MMTESIYGGMYESIYGGIYESIYGGFWRSNAFFTKILPKDST